MDWSNHHRNDISQEPLEIAGSSVPCFPEQLQPNNRVERLFLAFILPRHAMHESRKLFPLSDGKSI
jgi:hypothetical protein